MPARPRLHYHERMTLLNLANPKAELLEEEDGIFSPFRAAGLAALAVGAVAIGFFVGRELRFRYQFHRRTPSDFFSNAGDPITSAEYGMGI